MDTYISQLEGYVPALEGFSPVPKYQFKPKEEPPPLDKMKEENDKLFTTSFFGPPR